MTFLCFDKEENLRVLSTIPAQLSSPLYANAEYKYAT